MHCLFLLTFSRHVNVFCRFFLSSYITFLTDMTNRQNSIIIWKSPLSDNEIDWTSDSLCLKNIQLPLQKQFHSIIRGILLLTLVYIYLINEIVQIFQLMITIRFLGTELRKQSLTILLKWILIQWLLDYMVLKRRTCNNAAI